MGLDSTVVSSSTRGCRAYSIFRFGHGAGSGFGGCECNGDFSTVNSNKTGPEFSGPIARFLFLSEVENQPGGQAEVRSCLMEETIAQEVRLSPQRHAGRESDIQAATSS